MRIKLTLLTLLCALLPAIAATGVKGTIVDAQSGAPVANANILLHDQAIFVISGADGVFTISNAAPGSDVLEIIASGYDNKFVDVKILDNQMYNIGEIRLDPAGFDQGSLNSDNFLFNEENNLDDEGEEQSIGTIQGASSDIFYQMSNYNFQAVRFRQRGLDQNWQTGYVNGFNMNDLMRGRFNFSMFGGMTSSAFRNRTTEIGSAAAPFGYGSIGGSNNVTTYASEYAPGFKGNLSYTNSSYMLRAMLQYSTGLSRKGWAFSMSLIGRYAPEGVIEGTFYNSIGYFASLQKVFNEQHSLNLSTCGAPTQRATNAATTQQAYDLAGSNLYNPSWGYLDGKKKSSRIVESFDPSVMLNWIWKPKMGTRLNTGVAFRSNNYSSSAINWYQAQDPRPDYYRNLPYYYHPTADPTLDPELYNQQLDQMNYVADWWGGDKAHRQLDWNAIYQTNLLNRQQFDRDQNLIGQSSYILENRHSNFNAYMFNSYLDHRLTDHLTLQAGAAFNYTDARYYKTIRDLLGGEFWKDIDNFSERDFVGDENIMQNDMNHPDRKVYKGDVFGYDYHIYSYNTRAWYQNQLVTPKWDLDWAAEFSYTNFQRDGMMMNGRAEGLAKSLGIEGTPAADDPKYKSLGKGLHHEFFNYGVKFGATYKINGRNYFTGHVAYGTRAPLPNDAYISSRTKDAVAGNLKSEIYVSGDLSYIWNYRNFRGSLTGFYTHLWDGMKKTAFYDYELSSFVNYTMSGIESIYQGVELGLEYKIWNNLSIAGAAQFSRYRYHNDPMGVRSYENGSKDDVVRKVYLKGYYVGGTPQQAYSVALKYNINRWFFEANANWFGDNYYELAPTRHEEMPGLWAYCQSEEEYQTRRDAITHQDKLNSEWVVNLSIGKIVYTKFGSLNFNLSVNNLLNNRNIQTGGWQEGKFDYTTYDVNKFQNKVYYAQGIRIFFNVGIRF